MAGEAGERERLNRVAEALDALAKHAYLYAGPKTRVRRVAAVEAKEATLKVVYSDGGMQYIDAKLPRKFTVYISKPSRG